MESGRAGLGWVQILRWRRVDVMKKLQPIIINQCKFLWRGFDLLFPKKSCKLQVNLCRIVKTKQNNLVK